MTGKAKRSVLRRDICIYLVIAAILIPFFAVYMGSDQGIAAFMPVPVAIVTRILLDPCYVRRAEAYDRQHPSSSN